jgi:hypothetical protein
MKAGKSWLHMGCALATALTAVTCLTAQSRSPGSFRSPDQAGGHRGAVQALVYDGGDRFLSAGADGFLGIWSIHGNTAEDRFQLSSYAISSMVLRPGKPHIAIIEGDGLGLYRIAVWDYARKTNLFILRFRDPISYITYSAGGNFLIVSRSARTGVVFIHPETGEVLQSPEDLTGSVSFAATGRSERTMISYSPAGVLSYWELDSGEELRRFSVPGQISSPLLFGNNRFLGGIDPEGLVILDAVSGNTLARDRRITQGRLFPADSALTEFVCLSTEAGASVLYRFTIDSAGRLETRERRSLASSLPPLTGAAAAGNIVALGDAAGGVWTVAANGAPRPMDTRNQQPIGEAAAAAGTLVFIGGQNRVGRIPLDYRELRHNDTLLLEEAGPYTHVVSDENTGTFLFWQADNNRNFPAVRRIPAEGEAAGDSPVILNNLPMRFPIRSASVLEDEALFLDSVGNITVISLSSGELRFSFSSAGSLDAAFLDRGNIVIGRSAVSGNSPFLLINIDTGETVPIAYPAAIGARVYRGSSGASTGRRWRGPPPAFYG